MRKIFFLFFVTAAIISVGAQDKKKVIMSEKCTINIDPLSTKKPAVKDMPGMVIINSEKCELQFDKPVKIKILDIYSEIFQITEIHDMEVTNGGKSLEFNTCDSKLCDQRCRIDSPNSEKIMRKILSIKKELEKYIIK